MNYKKITLDTERKSFESIVAMQGDNKSRYIEATIVNRSIPVDLTGCTVKFSAIKPDITDIFNDTVISDAKGGKAQIELTNQTLAVPGVIQATLVILKEDMQLSVLPFFITVIENPYNSNAIESKSEYKALNNALTIVEGYAKELQDASVNLEEKYTTRLNNFDSQLETNILEATKRNLINTSNYKKEPTFVFIDDNGTTQFLTKLKPIFDKKGYKCGIGIVAEKVESVSGKYYMCLDDLKQLQKEGYEILNHSATHSSEHWRDNIDLNVIENEIKQAQKFMIKNGFPLYDILVYPYL